MTTRSDHAGGHRPLRTARARRARRAGLVLTGWITVIGLAACSAGATPNPTTGPSAQTAATAAASASASAIRPAASPDASASSPVGSATDPTGDVKPAYIDITRLDVGAAAGALTLGLDLADVVPPGSPAVGQVAYVFYLDVDADGTWDYTATLGLLPGGGYQPTFVDRTSSTRLEGAAFPGTAQLEGQHVSLTVRLDAMGCPAAISVQGAATQTKGGVRADDAVPDATDQWVTTQTACPA